MAKMFTLFVKCPGNKNLGEMKVKGVSGNVTGIKNAFRVSPRNALQHHQSNNVDQLNLRPHVY